jgi:hypothetical protein
MREPISPSKPTYDSVKNELRKLITSKCISREGMRTFILSDLVGDNKLDETLMMQVEHYHDEGIIHIFKFPLHSQIIEHLSLKLNEYDEEIIKYEQDMKSYKKHVKDQKKNPLKKKISDLEKELNKLKLELENQKTEEDDCNVSKLFEAEQH